MQRVLSVVAILFTLCNPALADFYAPYSGASFEGLTRATTIGEWDSTTDAAGLLLDRGPSNILTASEAFDGGSWAYGTTYTSVVPNTVLSPTQTLTAYTFKEYGAGGGGGAADTHYEYAASITVTAGQTYTNSLYVKAGLRSWIELFIWNAGDVNSAWFNVSTGVVGTTTGSPITKIESAGNSWYRISVTKKLTVTGTYRFLMRIGEADNDAAFAGIDQASLYIWGAQARLNNKWHTGAGVYVYTPTTASKPLLDLSPTATPTESKSYLQGADGRRLKARTFNGTTQYYSKAHDASMNVFAANHTMTFVIKSTVNRMIMGCLGAGGGIEITSSSGISYYKAAYASIPVSGPISTATDGYYHVIQIVRSGNIARFIIDGVSGTSVDITGYGLDPTPGTLTLGYSSSYFTGDILYTRIDAEALTDERLAVEREQIMGTLGTSKSVHTKANFTRASTGTQIFSDGALGYAATNIPRVGGDGGGVLVEEQRQNIALQSQTMGTTWFVSQGALSADSSTVLAPDGTATADGIIADADDESHFIGQTLTTTAVNHTFSVYARTGNKQWVTLAHNGVVNGYAIFDVAACRFYSKGAGALAALATAAGNSWCRVSVTFLAPAASGSIYFAPRLSAVTGPFPGDAVTVNMWFWGAQLEIGSHATSYIPTTSAAVIRYADFLTYDPWSISKNMFASGAATPTMWYNFDQPVYSGSTTTTSGGGYTLTTVGNPKLYALPNDSTYTAFDGTNDYFTISSADFNPTGAFSIVALYTPGVGVGTGNIISKDTVATRGPFQLLDNGGAPNLIVWNVADTTSTASGAALVAGKTSLVTATYDGAGNTRVMVDSAAAGTGYGAITTPKSTANLVYIGTSAGAQQYLGDMRFIAYYNGVVVTQAQHDAMLIRIKDARSLPVKLGNSYENKKLYVEFESKCEFASLSDMGINRNILSINGNTGTADADSNRLSIMLNTDGRFYNYFFGNDDVTAHFAFSAVFTNLNTWKKHRMYFDFANMANNSYKIDGVEGSWTNNSGTENFDLTNTLVRYGQEYTGTINGDCAVRNLRIRSTP